jgi:pimeloyl-ACP methyl ester carboxylesterase
MRSGKTNLQITENGAHLLWENAYAVFRKLEHFTEEDDEIFRQGLAQPGAVNGGINWYRANVPELGAIADTDYWPSRTASTNVPGLLIWGETDQTFVASFIDDLPNYVDNLEVCRIKDVGHSPMLETPEKVNDILLRFFR